MIPKAPIPNKFHISYEVDGVLRDKYDVFCSKRPGEIRQFFWNEHGRITLNFVSLYPRDFLSHWLLIDGGEPAGLHVIRPVREILADEMGVSIAEFQIMLPQYDSEARRLHKDDFVSQCPTNDRCINPSHLKVCTKDGVYIGRPIWADTPPAREWKPTPHTLSLVQTRITISRRRKAKLEKGIRDAEFKKLLAGYQSESKQKHLNDELDEYIRLLGLHNEFQTMYHIYVESPTEQKLHELDTFIRNNLIIFK